MASEGKDKDVSSKLTTREIQEPLLQPAVVTAFIAGIVLANLNKNLLLGYLLGGLTGTYIQQTYPYHIPNVKDTWSDIKRKWSQTKEQRNK